MAPRLAAFAAFAAALTVVAGCHAVLGEYTVNDETAGLECERDEDCNAAANEGCDDGRCAIRCLDDSPCPAFSECFAAQYCNDPIGTPCDPADPSACGGYACRDVNANAMPVPGYCPGYCSQSVPCPGGYTCFQLSCYLE